MMGAKTLDAQIADGTAKVEGDVSLLGKLAATMVDFDPRFEIMPGTRSQGPGRPRQPLPGRPGGDHRGIAWAAPRAKSCTCVVPMLYMPCTSIFPSLLKAMRWLPAQAATARCAATIRSISASSPGTAADVPSRRCLA